MKVNKITWVKCPHCNTLWMAVLPCKHCVDMMGDSSTYSEHECPACFKKILIRAKVSVELTAADDDER